MCNKITAYIITTWQSLETTSISYVVLNTQGQTKNARLWFVHSGEETTTGHCKSKMHQIFNSVSVVTYVK